MWMHACAPGPEQASTTIPSSFDQAGVDVSVNVVKPLPSPQTEHHDLSMGPRDGG